MDQRKERVLTAVVEDYIRTAEPVGSNTIVNRHRLGVSPATVRNDMVVLEDEGYLRQPHTSAGRVPTDKAYRHYVDQQVRLLDPSSEAAREFAVRLRQVKRRQIEDLLHEMTLVLSDFTDTMSLVMSLSRHVHFWGLSKIVHQPEFGSVKKIEFLCELLEREDKVADLLMTVVGEHRVKVLIGAENKLTELQDLSLILASYGLADRPLGSIGIIGPTRMDYVKTVPTVQGAARALSELLETAHG